MAHPLDDIAEWLRSAPLGFVGFSAERIDRTLEAIEKAKKIEVLVAVTEDAWILEWASRP